ncbi:hypothetical protein [Bradyrhizobium sp. 2S1]|uniref:hypothetical protein n=1 Tax=Bradyrhizobium sp. 2S1 TaxID=1404429 RepID=UPI001408C1F1|nr:hypothetical protein [Bradyrhizobium sp. 2S1]MCK7672367.1 hypothetical protein [Bradyrhizobium sp. 2S1]
MSLINGMLDKFLAAFQAYENKTISIEQLKTQLYEAMVAAARDVEVAHADALAKTYASFMRAVEKSKLMQVVWAVVTLSQLCVLLWHQVGIPGIVALGLIARYPSSGTTVEWSYLLLGACVGMGPMVLRAGSDAGTITDRLKSMVGK